MSTIGVIVIGRNEGERLLACLKSVRAAAATVQARDRSVQVVDVIYVDSNSTDDSVAAATALGAHVVVLDPHAPFTAARARNAGAQALFRRHPEVELLQFLDGDTVLNSRWLGHAELYLRHHAKVAVVCGRRREREPEGSIYNLMADMEWDTPVGVAQEFGGDAMIRAAAFLNVGGYSDHFIAGEEPDLAARLRLKDWQIARLNHEMTLHDIAMTRFSQWWKRMARSGHALAQLASTHGGEPLHFYAKARRSTLVWGLAVPLWVLLLSVMFSWWLILLLPLAYLYLWWRVYRYRVGRGDDAESAATYAVFTVVGKWPQLIGLLTFYKNLLANRQTQLMEYKSAAPARATNAGAAHPAAAAVGNT